MEVERKFLVPETPDLAGTDSDEIEQGYLAIGAEGEVRLRRKGEQLVLTAKRGSGISRDEAEVELDRESFEGLWPLTEGRRIEKTRYEIALDGGPTVELDVYTGVLAGLVVAEVEFGSEEDADAFDGPEWLGREVTDDPRFKNQRLAMDGAPCSA